MKKSVVRSLFVLFLATVMIFTSVPALADQGTGGLYMYVSTGNSGKLNLRALPSQNSQSLGQFPNGTAVLVESITNGNWALVQVNGQRGYMSLNFLSSAAPVTPIPAPTPTPTEDTTLYVYTGNSGKLHLREYASQNARSLGLYPNGTVVRVTARTGQWAFVNISGVSGYMMLKYLTANPSQPVVPQPTVNPGAATLMYVYTGNTGRLHLRQYASQSAPSLGLFPNGTQVYALNLGNGWSQVTAGGLTGYMMSKYLVASPYNPGPTATPVPQPVPVPDGATLMYVATGNTGRLHLRENMSTDAGSLGLFYNGTPVYVIANYGVWSYVNVGGKVGYMMTKFLSPAQPGTVVTPIPGAPTVQPAVQPTVYPGATAATVRQPNGSFVYLRSTASSQSNTNVICQVPSGSTVTVVLWGQSWCLVRYNGMEGYMVTQYLKQN